MDSFTDFARHHQPKRAINRFIIKCPYCATVFAVEGTSPYRLMPQAALQLVEHHALTCPKTETRLRVRINPYHLDDNPTFAAYLDPVKRAHAAMDLISVDWKISQVTGSYNPDVKCGAKCRNSKGPNCECSCGGKNHGAGYSVSS